MDISLKCNFEADANITPTIGIDFNVRTLESQGEKIKLHLADCAGHIIFRENTTVHYRSAIGLVVVYDVSNKASFMKVEALLDEFDQNAPQKVNKILVGTQ